MTKITRYFENYQDAYNYYGGTNVPSKEIALVGDASYVFVSSDNAGDGGNTQYFDAAMTNDEIVATQVDAAYVSGTTQGYEQGYSEGYPLGYTAGHSAGYTEGETAGYDAGHSAGYAEGEAAGYADGEADYIAGMIENGTKAITTTSQVDVMEYAYAQVSDANLIPSNIVSGTTILGVTGRYSGLVPSGTAYLQLNSLTDVSAYEFAYCEDTNGSYTAGYEGGTSYGYDWGYPIGYAEGQTYGEEIGYASGYTAGTTYGYDWGYPIGYTNGTTYGESIGYTTGYSAGYSYGYNEGLYAAPVNDKSLTFTASAANATVALNKVGSPNDITLSYSTDGGYTWAPYTVGTTITLANIGDTLKMKGTNERISTGMNNFYKFAITGVEKVTGEVTTLLNEVGGDVSLGGYCFYGLFNSCTSIKNAPELPSTTLGNYCYGDMFDGCSSLNKAPKLPATTLAASCYYRMFRDCTSLRTAPMLLSTNPTNVYDPYQGMFSGSGVIYLPYVAMSCHLTPSQDAGGNTLHATIIHKKGTTVEWGWITSDSTQYVYSDSAPDSMTSLWDDDPDVFMANVMAYYALNS